jgi:hypothetical protein
VLWTGDQIVSRVIVRASVAKINGLLRRRVLIWDNVSTNDYDVTRAFLAPIELRSPSLLCGGDDAPHVRGVLLNNPVSAALFDVPLMSLAHFAADPLQATRRTRFVRRFVPRGAQRARSWRLKAPSSCSIYVRTPFDVGVVVPRICARHRSPAARTRRPRQCRRLIRADLEHIVRLYDEVIGCQSRALAAALHAVLWPLKEEALLQQCAC